MVSLKFYWDGDVNTHKRKTVTYVIFNDVFWDTQLKRIYSHLTLFRFFFQTALNLNVFSSLFTFIYFFQSNLSHENLKRVFLLFHVFAWLVQNFKMKNSKTTLLHTKIPSIVPLDEKAKNKRKREMTIASKRFYFILCTNSFTQQDQ